MRYIKRSSTFLLVLIILISAFSNLGCKQANAAEKPGTPKISLAHTDDGRGVVIKIAKTTGAKGYYVYMRTVDESKYKKIGTVDKDGDKVRTYTIDELKTDKYYFKVRAYGKSNGKTVLGPKSKAKKIKVTKPSTIVLGTYYQDFDTDNDRKAKLEPIEWLVLDEKDDGSKFVVSKYGLDLVPYASKDNPNVAWRDSYLREWLNGTFYYTAFSEDERERVILSEVLTYNDPFNPDDISYEMTKDYVFVLSASEIYDYIMYNYVECACIPTEYALAKGAWVVDPEKVRAEGGYVSKLDIKFDGSCSWWPREAKSSVHNGEGVYYASAIISYDYEDANPDGVSTYSRIIQTTDGDICVRPAMWIKP